MKLKKNLEDLNLDYLKIAKAAQYCSAFFTALLYVELWCHSTFEGLETGGVSFKTTILDSIFEAEKEEASLAVVNLMRSSYIAIGDQDSLQGCGTSLLLNPQRRIEHYEDSGMWDQAILFHNMQISRGISNSKRMLIDSYKRYGLYETSLLCKEQDDVPDYECMWRLSDWTLPEMKRPIQNTQITFEEQMEKCRYFTLKSIHERDICGVMEHIEYARLSVVEKLKHTSLESSSNLYGILAHLQGLNEIEDFLNASSTDDLHLVLKKWERQDNIDKNSFYNIEPIMAQRITILNEYFKTSELEDASLYKKYLINLALKLSERARLENKTHIGMRALAFIQNLPQLSLDEKCRMALEDAQLCWKTNNKHTGRRILHQLYGDQNIDPRLKSYALKLNGEWSVESYSEHPNAIIKDYFLESLTIYKDLEKNKNDLKSIFDTYDTLGRFADKQYQQVSIHMTSDVFQKKMTNMQKAEETLKQLSKKSAPTLDERRAKAFHNAQKSIDKAEIENTRKEKDCFLHLALKYHLRSLTHSDDNNLQIFRVLALFLENRTCESIRELIEDEIPKIPSYKFLTILPQLTPHIANRNNNDYFSQQANNIIERCAREHPHHTLPIVLGLANSHKDSEYNDSQAKSSINEERVLEAKKLIKLFKNYSILTDIVTRLEMIFDASIQLAYLAPKTEHADRERKRRFNIPKNLKISKIRNFDSIPVLTDTLPIQKNKNYDNIIGIHSFDKYYELVGGLNAPKKIICIGTDGKPREQLVKGQDDLRQDAVMQQVFTIMNSLLSLNKQTCGLKIRTYKIIPLSMRSGVLEWAKNTMPIGLYLLGDDENMGAHQIYRPQDKSPSQCRKTMKDAANSNAEQKLIVFRRICENFKPVFHKFFEENFLHPTVWFERRRAYIQSVATTSMCGYILGIGDRHLSNILIDKTTAEVIHIDFGIAFEQGRTLPTPETVPFRLSRDFVDAMGVSGVEGAFKRSCEKTMTVMRDNYQTIMAILGVLLYDPLYSWTVSAAEATKRQRGSLDETGSYARTSPQAYETDISVNTTAERALLRLKAKLHGIEDGTPMSIEHQVGVLIHQAMDPVNLSKLFCGWQAHV
ncbi:hypothetical protein HHI36_012746 [Cryptolaemus montrouzieri]|uniref:Serine/threonine-protein kinase ATM n=1 Tax=Cryptolaemus montrouzieri TaxID=559131 RepID=A0ABD2NG57_9CUCU